MSLAIDAVSSAGGSGLGPFTWSHANAGNVMFLNVSWYRTLSTLDTFTFNGVAFTDVPATLIQTGDFNSVWFCLVSPSIGTLTASASFGTASTFEASFTVAGQIDANVQSVNDTTVNGAGTAGNPWGP